MITFILSLSSNRSLSQYLNLHLAIKGFFNGPLVLFGFISHFETVLTCFRLVDSTSQAGNPLRVQGKRQQVFMTFLVEVSNSNLGWKPPVLSTKSESTSSSASQTPRAGPNKSGIIAQFQVKKSLVT